MLNLLNHNEPTLSAEKQMHAKPKPLTNRHKHMHTDSQQDKKPNETFNTQSCAQLSDGSSVEVGAALLANSKAHAVRVSVCAWLQQLANVPSSRVLPLFCTSSSTSL